MRLSGHLLSQAIEAEEFVLPGDKDERGFLFFSFSRNEWSAASLSDLGDYWLCVTFVHFAERPHETLYVVCEDTASECSSSGLLAVAEHSQSSSGNTKLAGGLGERRARRLQGGLRDRTVLSVRRAGDLTEKWKFPFPEEKARQCKLGLLVIRTRPLSGS